MTENGKRGWRLGRKSERPLRIEALLLFEVMSDSFVTAWTVACQAPLPMEFSRREYSSGLPFPSPGDLLALCLLHW